MRHVSLEHFEVSVSTVRRGDKSDVLLRATKNHRMDSIRQGSHNPQDLLGLLVRLSLVLRAPQVQPHRPYMLETDVPGT